MTEQQAIKLSIAHWKRMIKWVEKQPKDDEPKEDIMLEAIKEVWDGGYCSLCLFYRDCSYCWLGKKFGVCGRDATTWKSVDWSSTWGEWLIHAKAMLKQLRSLR